MDKQHSKIVKDIFLINIFSEKMLIVPCANSYKITNSLTVQICSLNCLASDMNA